MAYVQKHLVYLFQRTILRLRQRKEQSTEADERSRSEDESELGTDVRVRGTDQIGDAAGNQQSYSPGQGCCHSHGLGAQPVGRDFGNDGRGYGTPSGPIREGEDADCCHQKFGGDGAAGLSNGDDGE